MRKDFGDIRIHTGKQADRAARSISAKAYTLGRDVAFRRGEYRPKMREGKRLLAHELTHVIQQAGPEAKEKGGPHPAADITEQRTREATDVRNRLPVQLGTSDERVIARKNGSDDSMKGKKGTEKEAKKEAGDQRDGNEKNGGTRTQTIREAGYTGEDPKGIIHIAWTLDDGPTKYTAEMRKKVGGRPATWFVQRNKLEARGMEKSLARLKRLQESGSEIGVHSMHEKIGHVCWFPTTKNSECTKAYDTTEEAMQDLKAFVQQLRSAGIQVTFVRLPTGLFDQLTAYLREEGSKNPGEEARKIIETQNEPGKKKGLSPAARKVKEEFHIVLRTLERNDLHLWGGRASGPEVQPLSWEAESSGHPDEREDNVTKKFDNAVEDIKNSKREEVSFIVLAHDISSKDVKEVSQDIKVMEESAKQQDILIKYHRMSSLYKERRGETP